MPSPVTGQHREGAEPGRGVAERAPREAAPRRIDSGNPPSVSFEREGGIDPGAVEWSYAPAPGRGGHALVGAGPGFPGATLLGSPAGLLGMNPFPIVGARIHPPLLRADTLSRERLNGWLDEATRGRVALIVAEAGFGKTTLLGDWARNSSRLTAWY